MMKPLSSLVFAWCLFVVLAVEGQSLELPKALKGKIPFNLENLEKAPGFHWESQEDSVWSLLYEGGSFREKQTEVFAYYASPSTLTGNSILNAKYPAIVAVHGGGATAFAEWVKKWAEKGYAAIAMDLGGTRPLPVEHQSSPWGNKTIPLENGGPDDVDKHKIFSIDKGFEEHWQFHAVSNIILAHSLVRSFSEVDSTKTAITGVSWGGYLTNIVAGIDYRFKAAVPVYCSGFIHEQSAWLERLDSLGFDNCKKWVELWGPSSYVGNARLPIFFINGTNDFAYYAESWQKTISLVPRAKQLMIPRLKHSHQDGVVINEIKLFVEDVFTDSKTMPTIGKPSKIGKWYESSIIGSGAVDRSTFIFTKDATSNIDREWKEIPAVVGCNTVGVAASQDIKAGYFLLTYGKEGRRISSSIRFSN